MLFCHCFQYSFCIRICNGNYSWRSFSYVFSTLIDWFVSASVDGIVSNWAPIREASDKVANDTCSNSPTGHHDFTLKASAFSPEIHTETCRYCNVTWSSFFLEAERGFVDGLDRTEASAGVAVTGYSAGQMSNGSYSSYPYWNGIYRLVSSSPEKTLQLIKNLGVNDKALIVAISDRSPYELLGFYFDADGLFKCTVFENPVGYQNSSLLGVWSLSDLTVLNSDLGGWRNSSGYYFRLFYSRAYAEAYDGYIAKNCAYFDFSRDPYISGNDTYFYFSLSFPLSLNLTHIVVIGILKVLLIMVRFGILNQIVRLSTQLHGTTPASLSSLRTPMPALALPPCWSLYPTPPPITIITFLQAAQMRCIARPCTMNKPWFTLTRSPAQSI